MKKLVTLLSILVPLSLFSQEFDRQKLDQYLKVLEDKEKANFSLALSKGNTIIYEQQGGYLTDAVKRKTDSGTKFRIGSITKTFTATIIFQLVEDGKLKLEDKLSKFFPDITNADKITIEHLLGHRSGIHNYTAVPSFGNNLTKKMSQESMLEILESMVSDFEPGTSTSYSNSGYFLLGMIIEKITKKSYEQNVEKRVIQKLGLNSTAYGKKINTSNNEAYSQIFNNGWMNFPAEWDMSVAYAAGAITSTPRDLNKFMYALFNNQLVSESSVNKMREVIGGLGHGIFSVPFGSRKAYGHNGRIDSFDSGSYYFIEDDINITLLCNGLTIPYNDMLIGILSILFDKPFEIPTYDENPITLDAALLPNYEGVFSSDITPLKITIKVADNKLTAQATGQSAFPLTPYSAQEFRFDPASIVILFGKKSDGTDYSVFKLKQGGQNVEFKKD